MGSHKTYNKRIKIYCKRYKMNRFLVCVVLKFFFCNNKQIVES